MDPAFWVNQAEWPSDFQDFIFIGRAFHIVGKCLFEDQWSESVALVSPEPRLALVPSHSENIRALKILRRTKPRLVEDWPTESVVYSLKPGGIQRRPALLSRELWAEARRTQAYETDVLLPPLFERRDQTVNAMAAMLACGEVRGYLRSMSGGRFIPRPPEFWTQNPIWLVLRKCAVDHDWVFVDGVELRTRLERDRKQPLVRLSERDVLALLKSAFEERGDILTQADAVELIQRRDPEWRRDTIRQLLKRITGETRPGPKGARDRR